MMRTRLAIFFLLWSAIVALGMGNNGVPPFFGTGQVVVNGIPSIFNQAGGGSQALYWGFRAAETAKAGNNIANICNPTDAACADMASSATTGNMVVTTVGGVTCTSVTPNCTVKTLYEQETCGSTCNMTQATIANRPLFVPVCTPNGHPCMTCTAANSQKLVTVGNVPNVAQAFSGAWVSERIGATSSTVWSGTATTRSAGGYDTANQGFIFSGSSFDAGATDGAWHSFQSVHSGASSSLTVDNSTTTGSAGTNSFSGTVSAALCVNFSGVFLNGNVAEVGIFGSFITLTSGQITSIYNNQHAYW